MFFFEKKNRKTFGRRRALAGQVGDSRMRVFWFFFSEKKAFLPSGPQG
jgi:hypothetical protein